MKGNPEDAVIADINALEADAVIDSQLAAGEPRPRSVPACRCGAPWHGLPRSGCPGTHAAGERDLPKEPAGEVYIDEQYELRASHGLLQVIPSTFVVNPPPVDREYFLRQFNDAVHRMVTADAANFVIISRYDSPMDQLLAVDDGRASRFRWLPQRGLTVDAARTEKRRGAWQRRLRRLFRSDSG
ncbi:hypothetical protein [Mycobacteroides abscessus]|uniref:hypothetical protein n=1 Tax=Mycobacteroides abscessus TaxID=36809 RepID=UPI0012FFF9E0|nr:hypothetical protein [Mycobacteroides abscessus]